MRLIICDFDGTIYLDETPRLFLNVLARDARNHSLVKAFYLSNSWLYILYKLGFCRELMRKRVVDGIANLLKGMDQRELDEFFEACVEIAQKKFNPEIIKRIERHLESGAEVLILSGAFSPFLALVAKKLGVKYWLGTELELKNGFVTGQVLSFISGPEKVTKLEEFLQAKEKSGIKFDLKDSYAYADDFHDLPLLSLVGHPVAVNPDPKLYKWAVKNGWEIITRC
ncbi:MAG: HAD-IB family hydrolase [Firmicutes bacterium]|nr:HAD-IB family hydrolase [Bacillota bacterium]